MYVQITSQNFYAMKWMFTLFILMAFFSFSYAQVQDPRVSLSARDIPLKKVFKDIERQTVYRFLYDEEVIGAGESSTIIVEQVQLSKVLDQLLSGKGITWKIVKKSIVLSREQAPPAINAAAVNEFTGIVLDAATGMRLPGATVAAADISKAVITDNYGLFDLTSDRSELALKISYIGYYSKELVIQPQTDPKMILLAPNRSMLNETVVTGYSTKKTGELTGALQKISGEQLRRGITSSDPVSMLKGRVTGLYISEQNAIDPNGSGGQVFMRGQSTIGGVGVDLGNLAVTPNLTYGPLLVVDGVIMAGKNLKEVVNAQDIEEITTLKDASATAIYGSRAAAGVIVVTTKKGKAGQAQLSAEVKYGVNVPNFGPLKFMNGAELYDLQKKYYSEDYQVNNASLAGPYPVLQNYLDHMLPAQADVNHSYNWSDYAFRTGSTLDANISARGGTDKSRYYIGGSYYDEQATLVNNRLKRKTFRINLDNNLTKKLSANITLNGIFDDGKSEISNAITGKVSNLASLVPWASPYDSEGKLLPALSYKMNGATQPAANPVFENQYNYQQVRAQRIAGSIKLEYTFNHWLSFISINSLNIDQVKTAQYLDVQSYAGGKTMFAPQGFLGTNTSYMNAVLTSNQLHFRKSFGDHSLRALVATEYGTTRYENTTVNVNHVKAGYPVISLGTQVGGMYDLSVFGIPATKSGNIEGGNDIKGQFSALGEAGYAYKDRYNLSASLRTDASSSFGRNKRYATFYSVGASWLISEEAFLKGSVLIDKLKLRANYGTSGSQLGDNFLTRTLYRPDLPYTNQAAASIAVLGNPDLRWEITKAFNAGIDLGLFSRVTLSVDVYNRRSENLLQNVVLPALAGFSTQWQNVGVVRNRGLEIMVNTDNIIQRHFKWNSSFNISFNQNKLVSTPGGKLKQGVSNIYLYPGEDINTLKAVKYAGVDPQSGKALFEKLLFDDKGALTGKTYVNTIAEVGAGSDSRQYQAVGHYQPTAYGGLTNTFAYHNFTLDILLTFALGYKVNDVMASNFQGNSLTYYNQIRLRNSQVQWTTPGQTNATEPDVYYNANTNYFLSDKYIHDASHIRLRNIRLGYDLPVSWLQRMKLSRASIYLSADNLLTLTSRYLVAADPEGPAVGDVQQYGTSTGTAAGIPRRFLAGLQVTF
jgi:TonB-linked SusC/RagA family outer membrane protein